MEDYVIQHEVELSAAIGHDDEAKVGTANVFKSNKGHWGYSLGKDIEVIVIGFESEEDALSNATQEAYEDAVEISID